MLGEVEYGNPELIAVRTVSDPRIGEQRAVGGEGRPSETHQRNVRHRTAALVSRRRHARNVELRVHRDLSNVRRRPHLQSFDGTGDAFGLIAIAVAYVELVISAEDDDARGGFARGHHARSEYGDGDDDGEPPENGSARNRCARLRTHRL